MIAYWNDSLERHDPVAAELPPLSRHRWILRTRENRSQRWTYMRRVMLMVGEEEFGMVRLPRILSPIYKLVRFWNIFRKARASSKDESARAEG